LQPRTSDIDEKKVGAVWHMLTQARANAYNRDTWSSIDLVMFLMLTGARIGEASALTWDRVSIDKDDPENCWWHIPDPKNRNPCLISTAHLHASPAMSAGGGACAAASCSGRKMCNACASAPAMV